MNNHNSLPRHLVEFLGDKNSIATHVAEYPGTITPNEMNQVLNKTLFDIIKPFYDSKNIDIAIDNIIPFIKDPWKSIGAYMGNNHPIVFGVSLSEKGLVTSYNDGSEYLRNQNFKRSWEQRKPYHEKYDINTPNGTGIVMSHIYNKADIIYVDISEGTLYAGLGIDKIVAK